jgi:hypothetical protein
MSVHTSKNKQNFADLSTCEQARVCIFPSGTILPMRKHDLRASSETAAAIFSRNVDFLVQHRQQANPAVTKADIAKDLHISLRNLTNLRKGAHAATLETVESIAHNFNMESWQLLLPDLPSQVLLSPKVARHVRAYLRAKPEIQEKIEDLADALLQRASR